MLHFYNHHHSGSRFPELLYSTPFLLQMLKEGPLRLGAGGRWLIANCAHLQGQRWAEIHLRCCAIGFREHQGSHTGVFKSPWGRHGGRDGNVSGRCSWVVAELQMILYFQHLFLNHYKILPFTSCCLFSNNLYEIIPAWNLFCRSY